MKRKIKKTISAFLIFSILTINMAYCVFAAVNPNSPLGKAIDAYERTYDNIHNLNMTGTQFDDYLRTLAAPLGLMVGGSVYVNNALAVLLKGKTIGGETIPQNATDQEVFNKAAEILSNNITVVSDNMIYNDASKTIMNYYYQAIKENTGYYYAYSLNIRDNVTNFVDGVLYNKTLDFIRSKQNNYICLISYSYGVIMLLPINEYGFVQSVINYPNYPQANAYNNNSWSIAQTSDYIVYKYSQVSQNYVEDTFNQSYISYAPYFRKSTDLAIDLTGTPYGRVYVVNADGYGTYKIYYTVEDFRNGTQGVNPYYENDNWKNFINNSGNYTVDSSNSNNITYGDITTYVDSFNTQNGKYPDDSNVQIFIENNIPPSDGGGSGGGSGGSNGNGPTFDLGFLGTIGNLIGSLITGIGNLITGILQGIVNAFNSILEFLTDTIQDVGQTLPNQFFAFIGAMFNWLPEPMLNAFKALFLMMLFLGIFNLIKR